MKRYATLALSLCLLMLSGTALAQTARFSEAPAMNAFARALAVSDGTVLIGEPNNPHQPGLVHVYEKGDEGTWDAPTQLQASDGVVGDNFGRALATDGDWALVGAPSQSEGNGAAYLFQRSDDGAWVEAARLAPPDTVESSGFGSSVAFNGTVALIGAPRQGGGTGVVYAFRRADDGTWTREAALSGSEAGEQSFFGAALLVDDAVALVGAPRQGDGAVYAFGYDEAAGAWSETEVLTADGVSSQARFGSALAHQDGTVLIGAPRHDAGAGAVFSYQQDADGAWMQQSRLMAFDGDRGHQFGAAMAVDGDDVWIGAPGASSRRGTLYRYTHDPAGATWLSAQKLSGPEQKQGDQFASTVAVGDDLAVVGLTGTDYGAGTAAIFERDAEGAWAVQTTVIGEKSPVLSAVTGEQVDCTEGEANQFGCNNVDLVSFLPLDQIGAERGVRVNDIWGWTDPQTGREYALVGRIDGTSFVDVTDAAHPVYVGTLPMTEGSRGNIWRDIKVYQNHAFVVADNVGDHGMQVFDLTKLRQFDPSAGAPMTFDQDAHYDRVASSHNVVINEATGFAYIVGAGGGGQTCGGGLHMVNIQEPKNPTFAGCFADPSTGRAGTGYTHDAQCVVYAGPDTEHQGQEICIGANETALSIADVTDKAAPKALSTASYPDAAYVHQGWLTEDHRYFFQNDELDEINGSADSTRTLIWDLQDLDDPQLVREYMLSNRSSDHNLYIKGNTMYQSNYVSGLRILDVSDPANPVEVGHFDTEPFGEDVAGFSGTWSNYPFFDSGIIVMTSMQEGLFILRQSQPEM